MPPTTTSTVRCQHCAEAFATKRPAQAKWCPTCRVAKAVLALSGRPSRCDACSEPFYKLDRKERICSTCTGSPVGVTNTEAPCAFCHGTERLLPGIKLCYPCTTQGGKVHAKVVVSLARLLASRKAAPVSP